MLKFSKSKFTNEVCPSGSFAHNVAQAGYCFEVNVQLDEIIPKLIDTRTDELLSNQMETRTCLVFSIRSKPSERGNLPGIGSKLLVTHVAEIDMLQDGRRILGYRVRIDATRYFVSVPHRGAHVRAVARTRVCYYVIFLMRKTGVCLYGAAAKS